MVPSKYWKNEEIRKHPKTSIHAVLPRSLFHLYVRSNSPTLWRLWFLFCFALFCFLLLVGGFCLFFFVAFVGPEGRHRSLNTDLVHPVSLRVVFSCEFSGFTRKKRKKNQKTKTQKNKKTKKQKTKNKKTKNKKERFLFVHISQPTPMSRPTKKRQREKKQKKTEQNGGQHQNSTKNSVRFYSVFFFGFSHAKISDSQA